MFSYTDTLSAKPTTITIPTLDFTHDFALQSNSGKEAVLVNTTTNLDSPESIRFSIENVANVYAGNNDIDPTLYAAQKKGKSLVCSLRDSLEVTNDGIKSVYPIQAHFVVKYPISGDVTTKDIQTVLYRMISLMNNGIQKSGSVYVPIQTPDGTVVRLNEEVRGALAPSDTIVNEA